MKKATFLTVMTLIVTSVAYAVPVVKSSDFSMWTGGGLKHDSSIPTNSEPAFVVHPGTSNWYEFVGSKTALNGQAWQFSTGWDVYSPDPGAMASLGTDTVNFPDGGWQYALSVKFGTGATTPVIADRNTSPNFPYTAATTPSGTINWAMSYYNSPVDAFDETCTDASGYGASATRHTMLLGSLQNGSTTVSGTLGASGSSIRIKGLLRNNGIFNGSTKVNQMSDGWFHGTTAIWNSDIYGYILDTTVDFMNTTDGKYYYGWPTSDDPVVLKRIKYLGDANFDDVVNVSDLGILATNYGQTGKTWAQGDFNLDGVVNVGDLGILATNYGSGMGSVPEPLTLGLLATGGLALLRRKN